MCLIDFSSNVHISSPPTHILPLITSHDSFIHPAHTMFAQRPACMYIMDPPLSIWFHYSITPNIDSLSLTLCLSGLLSSITCNIFFDFFSFPTPKHSRQMGWNQAQYSCQTKRRSSGFVLTCYLAKNEGL